MAQQPLDHTGNEQYWRFIERLNAMFAELYAMDADDPAAVTAAITAALAAAYSSGTVTSAALTTAAGTLESLTITDAKIAATSKVMVSVLNGTNAAGIPVISTVTPGAGSATVRLLNADALAAFNGTVILRYFVVV